MNNRETFKKELTTLINVSNIDTSCNAPDYILAEYLIDCLEAYIKISNYNSINLPDLSTTDTKTLGVTPPSPVAQPNEAKPAGGYIAELYRQAGGIPVKQRYIDEVKQREN